MATQLTADPKLYIGMDMHKKSWSVHMRTDISDHKSMTIPPEEEILLDYVEEHFPDHSVSLTYEAGCCGFHTVRYFLSLGWEVLVVNPADVPMMDKQYYQKTDKLDCQNLSRQLKAGHLKGIFVPDLEQDLLKSLLRQRTEESKQLRRVKTQIKALLLYHQVELSEEFDNPNWSKAFFGWLRELQWEYSTGQDSLDSKLRILELFHREDLLLANQLRAYRRKHYKKDYYLLKSIPGIGGYLASAILAEVGDLRRFNTEGQFASYIGIVPMMRNSGGAEKITGVTPRCRALLRSYIIESTWQAYRLDPQIQSYYRKHIGRNPKSIIVKIARKMLNRMLSVIKNERSYQLNQSTQNHFK